MMQHKCKPNYLGVSLEFRCKSAHTCQTQMQNPCLQPFSLNSWYNIIKLKKKLNQHTAKRNTDTILERPYTKDV